MLNVIGIGDNVCDKYSNLNIMFPGGQALNFAVYCKQMGMNASYIGTFGSDYVAMHLIETLNDLDIDISHCRHVDGENGYAVVDIIDGDRVFITSNKGGVLKDNPIVIANDDLDYLKNFHIIHTSNNSYFDDQLEKLSELDTVVSYDFSTSWTNTLKVEKVCKYIDFAFLSCSNLNESEVKDILMTINNLGTCIVVGTRGIEGSIVYDGDMFFSSKPHIVKSIDTLGAGDSFAATFVTSYLLNIGKKRNKNIDKNEYIKLVNKCLDNSNKMSAKTCITMGAFGYGIKI